MTYRPRPIGGRCQVLQSRTTYRPRAKEPIAGGFRYDLRGVIARPLRVEFSGAVYHLTARGNDRQHIYLEADDYRRFLVVLTEVVARYGFVCHSYCLMGNHYHLLVETPRPNLALGMRQLNGLYCRRFNRAHGRSGHLFQVGTGACQVVQSQVAGWGQSSASPSSRSPFSAG
jgi:REP element-mobilizing transposase RayT